MNVSSVSKPIFAAMAAGLRSQMQAQTLATALNVAGALDPELADALQAVSDTGASLAQAGAALAQSEALGSLIDAIG